MLVLNFDEQDGIYTDNSPGMEHRAFKNVGLWIGPGSDFLCNDLSYW